MPDTFTEIRDLIVHARASRILKFDHIDELNQMRPADGLELVPVHPLGGLPMGGVVPEVTAEMKKAAHLWVVREVDTVHAPEYCKFGDGLAKKKIKHTNLTGGAPAFSGGELIWIGEREVLVNGCSGRYGPLNASELAAAAQGFAKAGLKCWSSGYDEGSGYCFRFGASVPVEVSAI